MKPAVAELEAQLAAGADLAAAEPTEAVPEALRRRAQDWEREADLLMRLAEHTEPVLAEQLPGHPLGFHVHSPERGSAGHGARAVAPGAAASFACGDHRHGGARPHRGLLRGGTERRSVGGPGGRGYAGRVPARRGGGSGRNSGGGSVGGGTPEYLESAEDIPPDVLFDELSFAEESEQDSSVRSLWGASRRASGALPNGRERIWAVSTRLRPMWRA